jgi:hypothetical protein
MVSPNQGEQIGGGCLQQDKKMFLESSKSMKSKILTSAMSLDVIVTTVSLWRSSMDRTDRESTWIWNPFAEIASAH